MFNAKMFVAELIGTFTLVLIGAGLAVIGGALFAAWGFGFVVVALAYAYGHVSTQFNPAVTFGMAINKMLSWSQAFYNWIAQLLGAVLAAALLNNWHLNGATVPSVGMVEGLVVEFLLTFFLVTTALLTSKNSFGGLATGFALFFGVLFGFGLTGGSLNFARSFGPALFTGGLSSMDFWVIYFAGPMLGGLIAAFAHRFFAPEGDAMMPAPAKKSASRRR